MTKFKVPLTITAIVLLAFALRVLGQLEKVFTPDGVMFHDTDSYYYLWLSSKLLSGQAGAYSPLVYMIVAVARLFGGSEHAMEVVAAWYPAVTGALLTIPVYFLGKAVFDSKFVGLTGAFLVAVMPSVLFNRSLLGDFDHHVFEALLSTVVLLCAVQVFKGRRLLWLAGGLAALGLYLQIWIGARMIVGVIAAYALAVAVMALAQKKPGARDRFAVVAVAVFGAAWLYRQDIIGIFSSDALFFNAASVTRWAVSEAGPFPVLALFASFGIYFLPFSVAGIATKRLDRADGLFLLWSVIMIAVTFLQARWGYYSAIPVALYSAWFIRWASLKMKVAVRQRIAAGAMIVIPLLMSMPNITFMASLPADITPEWYAASRWLRDNTPNRTDYSVLSWWDYGYWIQYIGHRQPVVTPGSQSGVPEASLFLTATDEATAQHFASGRTRVVVTVPEIPQTQYVMVSKRMVDEMYWVMALDAGAGVDTLEQSAAYRLYYGGEFAGFKLVKEIGEVRIFEAAPGN